jgi:hypothetical protein
MLWGLAVSKPQSNSTVAAAFQMVMHFYHDDRWAPRAYLSLSETQSGWQVESNWVMLLVDERCLQLDLVGADRIVPVASVAASRDLDASSSTQRAAT